jgi:anti-sigma B factor antagonist
VDLTITTREAEGRTVVSVAGEIDVYTAPRLHDGSLQLVCNQDRLLKIFRITGLAKVFVIHDTPEAALATS